MVVDGRLLDVTSVPASTLAGYAPYTQFARAAYCDTNKVATWSCGGACDAVGGFEVSLTGGDGNGIQLYFVGYWPQENAVVVSHQGTDPTQFLSVLTDINILLDPLDSNLFPGVPSNVLVHSGFMNAQATTAVPILEEVRRLMSAHGTNKVVTTGHSLGGAISMLDAMYFKLNIPGANIISRTYGLPRVGNPEFASYFDGLGIDFVRINNEKDVIPIVPGRGLGFRHASGEIHILGPGRAVSCSGQDNEVDAECQISSVPDIFSGSILDHLGPYEGISTGTIFCN
ncbi:alpha/beta-hydrolase [Pterulicium gracile]|uniref:Alpha/beta-hydrolase n=1 Tax=Pterulicium gracile TaxID=1884261 RepID=A0A5C3QNY6_9AGAR|nr:alpha/beta-hydrolase [Pterula gracilis]